jgi:hypothetical protein
LHLAYFCASDRCALEIFLNYLTIISAKQPFPQGIYRLFTLQLLRFIIHICVNRVTEEPDGAIGKRKLSAARMVARKSPSRKRLAQAIGLGNGTEVQLIFAAGKRIC